MTKKWSASSSVLEASSLLPALLAFVYSHTLHGGSATGGCFLLLARRVWPLALLRGRRLLLLALLAAVLVLAAAVGASLRLARLPGGGGLRPGSGPREVGVGFAP